MAGDAADDMFDAISRTAERVDLAISNIRRDCAQCTLVGDDTVQFTRDDDGFLLCTVCKQTFDE